MGIVQQTIHKRGGSENNKQMQPQKSLRPNVMHVYFFQKFWHIVGKDVVFLALKVLNEGLDIAAINLTYVSLIPKTNNPSLMSHFHPICLCNVLYKIVSKFMANRLKIIMNSLIDDSQSAFYLTVLSQIMLYLLLSFFIALHIKRKNSPFMALKLDMSKAFGYVEWGFLEVFMKSMHFLDHFLSLIMNCISSIFFSILLIEYR